MKIFRIVSRNAYVLFLIISCTAYSNPELDMANKTALPTHQNYSTAIVTPQQSLESIAPTLTADQARSEVLDLLEHNNGCALPCFWGIIPGETKWSEKREFLRSISSQYSNDSDEINSEFFFADLYFPANDIQGPWDLKLEMGIHKDLIRTISVSDFDVPSYNLREFLLSNGKPDEIWVFTNSQGFVDSPSRIGFLVSLFYSQKQMIAAFGRGRADMLSDWINGCIQYSPSLNIWSLDNPFSFPEAANFFYGNNIIEDGWKKLSEATQGELDVDRFYETFSKQNTEPCFRTPKSLWSSP